MDNNSANSRGVIALIANNRAQLGQKPDLVESGRLAEAQRLTRLFSEHKSFSFGRLGDYEVGLLLNPYEAATSYNISQERISGTQAGGSPGLEPTQVARLYAALGRISYLDFHERLWKDNTLLNQLTLTRPIDSYCNTNRETSYILPTWLAHEFKNYCYGRRILFCGAEAPLLKNLLQRPTFRSCAKDFWPDACKAFFLRPREDGRNLSKNLDLIKADLQEAIHAHHIDTLFLSLGGASKILCCELAEELEVCAIDFGASLRSLTYSGSDGNLAARSTHSIFLYRIPFDLHMGAVQETYPNLTPEVLLAKAHAQLLLEVQAKEVGWSHHADEYDFCASNMSNFRDSLIKYKSRYRHLFTESAGTRRERIDFLHFLWDAQAHSRRTNLLGEISC